VRHQNSSSNWGVFSKSTLRDPGAPPKLLKQLGSFFYKHPPGSGCATKTPQAIGEFFLEAPSGIRVRRNRRFSQEIATYVINPEFFLFSADSLLSFG
jgi:hypothetical protein